MATAKRTAKVAAVKHHRVWLIPLALVVIGAGVGFYFLSTKSTPKFVQVESISKVQNLVERTQLPQPVDRIIKTDKPKFDINRYNQGVQTWVEYITPTISLLSILGGLGLLVINIIKAIRSIKPS